MLGEILNAAKRFAVIMFYANLILTCFYIIFAVGDPTNPVVQFLSGLGYINIAQKLSSYGGTVMAQEVTSYGYMVTNPIGLWQIALTVFQLIFFGTGIIAFKLLMMIPNYGPILAYAVTPIFAIFGIGGFLYMVFCVVLRRC